MDWPDISWLLLNVIQVSSFLIVSICVFQSAQNDEKHHRAHINSTKFSKHSRTHRPLYLDHIFQNAVPEIIEYI